MASANELCVTRLEWPLDPLGAGSPEPCNRVRRVGGPRSIDHDSRSSIVLLAITCDRRSDGIRAAHGLKRSHRVNSVEAIKSVNATGDAGEAVPAERNCAVDVPGGSRAVSRSSSGYPSRVLRLCSTRIHFARKSLAMVPAATVVPASRIGRNTVGCAGARAAPNREGWRGKHRAMPGQRAILGPIGSVEK